jgi:hypothetical protein
MRFLRVEWRHLEIADPVLIFSEIDAKRVECRKVEIYRDARQDYAGPDGASGSTKLSSEPIPELVLINSDPQFFESGKNTGARANT